MKNGSSLLLSALTLTATSAAAIDRVSDLDQFLEDLTPRSETLSLTGRVMNVNFSHKYAVIILSDEHGERAELYRFPNLIQPEPGDTIATSGHAYMGKSRESFFSVEDFRLLSHAAAPEPLSISLSELNTARHHLLTVRTEGTVIDAVRDETDFRFMILLLKDDGCVIPVTVPIDGFGDRHDLIDARIRVTGVYRRSVSGIRKVSSPSIMPVRPEDIEILTPPPDNPFSVPTLEKRFYLSTDDILRMSKRSVSGEVLAVWGGNLAMLRTAEGQIVNLRLANEVTSPPCGAMIVAAGQPETDLFRINLTAVRWKTAETPVPSVDEETTTGIDSAFWINKDRNALNGQIHGKLLSLSGIVRTLPSPDDLDRRFFIETNGLQLPVDVTANPGILDELTIGSVVGITGRCLLLTEAWHPSNAFPQAKGFAVVIRSPSDLVILSRPSPWTPARLLFLIAILVLALAGVGAWNLIQRHFAKLKIVERTRLSVELHDTLSQNLAGVACQVAAGANAIADDPKTAISRIKAAERMLQSCRTELRHCLFDLRSDMLEETNFKTAILKALNQLTDEAAVSIRFTAHRSDFPDPTAHAILSVIRELTANAVRHGHAASVKIAGCADKGQLRFSVTDDGSGFDPQHCAGIAEGHFGLSGVRDRLKRLNGEIVFSSTPGKGARAVVTIPIPKS